MPIKRIGAAGTRERIVAASTPANVQIARLTIQWLAANAGSVYLGFPGPNNAGAIVSSTVYDCILNATTPSVTVGLGETKGNATSLSDVWWDADNDNEGFSYFVEQI